MTNKLIPHITACRALIKNPKSSKYIKAVAAILVLLVALWMTITLLDWVAYRIPLIILSAILFPCMVWCIFILIGHETDAVPVGTLKNFVDHPNIDARLKRAIAEHLRTRIEITYDELNNLIHKSCEGIKTDSFYAQEDVKYILSAGGVAGDSQR